MEKEALLTVLVGLAAILAIVVMAVKPVVLPEGATALFVEKPKSLGLQLWIDKATASVEDTIILSASTQKPVKQVVFSASNNGCTQAIVTDNDVPYQASWQPGCGAGTYTVTARAVHESLQYEIKTASITVEDTGEPLSVIFASVEDGTSVTGIVTLEAEATGASRVELYADSVYVKDGTRSLLLLDTLTEAPYAAEWDTFNDAYDVRTGDFSEYTYAAYGPRYDPVARQVVARAYDSSGGMAEHVVTVRVYQDVN